MLHGPQLNIVCGLISLFAWILVVSPLVVLIIWGSWLVVILDRHIIGLAVIMAGTSLLLVFYSIMLWWRTQWQSSTGLKASQRYSPSGFFFGISAIALAINMLFICRMVFNGNGLDVGEYVRKAYKFAFSDCIEVGHVS